MKNNRGFWSFIAWLLVTVGLVAGLATYQNRQVSLNKPANSASGATTSTASGLTLNMVEISKHNSATDCWLLINNKVYDVTAAVASHPGGSSPLIRHCGQEATQAFNTKDIGRPHSVSAESQLTAYYIGDFNQALGQVPVPPTANNNTAVTPAPSPANPVVAAPAGQVTLDLTEIAKHNSAGDCWLLISGQIYNVTSAIASHPGGSSPITRHCGTDATQAFATKDIGRPHSASAAGQLAAYLIGGLNQTIGQAQIQQNVQKTNAVVPPAGEGEDD